MTVISWLIEFIAGVFIMTISASIEYGVRWGPAIFIPDICVNFIVIPASYLFNNEVNRSLIAVEGWCRGINRAIFPHQPYQIQPPMELQPIAPNVLSSSDNILARAQNSAHDIHTNRTKPFSGGITKETNSNIKKVKRIPARSQAGSLDLPRMPSPPQLDAVESQPIESGEDIETIASEYVTAADMLNADRISTVPENNWI